MKKCVADQILGVNPQEKLGEYKKICIAFTNPLHRNMSMHILHSALYTFPKVLTRRRYWSVFGVKGLNDLLWVTKLEDQ